MAKLFEKKKQHNNWQLFRATNYISLMWPCFLLSRLHGLFPYRINANKFVLSKIGYIASTIAITIYMLLLGFILYHMDIATELKYDTVPGTLQGHCYLLLGWSLAVVNYIRSHARMKLLDNIANKTLKVPSHFFLRLSKTVHIKDIIGFLFLVGQMPNLISNRPLLMANKLLLMYTTIIVYIMDALYVNCVFVIGICFENINGRLKKLWNNMEHDEPHMLRRMFHIQRNPIILKDLQLVMKEHNDISELIIQLNDTFNLQLIGTVTMTFAEITFSLYFYILQMSNERKINLEKQIWYSYFLTSVSYYAIKFSAMVYACENSKSQATQTGYIVHEMLNDTTDREIANELKIFSLQLLHRDNCFKAKGLTIDAVLLTSIVSGITTYLLILIQFLVASNRCDYESTSSKITATS